MSNQQTDQYPTQFSNADIRIRSSDGILLKIHSTRLYLHSGTFPGPEIRSNDEIVPLQESSKILELLFDFMYPKRQPELDGLPFGELVELAEAAEKYQVYAAMGVCRLHMRDNIEAHPEQVLAYALKHDYEGIADRAAPLTLAAKLPVVSRTLGSFDFEAWVNYRENWLHLVSRCPGKQLSEVYHSHPPHFPQYCPAKWASFRLSVTQMLLDKLSSFQELDNVFDCAANALPDPNPRHCGACRKDRDEWKAEIKRAILKLPAFTEVARQLRTAPS